MIEWIIIGLVTMPCLAFVSIYIAKRLGSLFLSGLFGVSVYAAIPALLVASFGVRANDVLWAGIYGAALSFFTVIIPVLAMDYRRFERGE